MKLYRYCLWNFNKYDDRKNEDVFLNINVVKDAFPALHILIVEDTHAVIPYDYLGKVINRLELRNENIVIDDTNMFELYLTYKDDRHARKVFKDFFNHCGYKVAAEAITCNPITHRRVMTYYYLTQSDKNYVKKVDKKFASIHEYNETIFLSKNEQDPENEDWDYCD